MMQAFEGQRQGYMFTNCQHGLGYYLDSVAASSREALTSGQDSLAPDSSPDAPAAGAISNTEHDSPMRPELSHAAAVHSEQHQHSTQADDVNATTAHSNEAPDDVERADACLTQSHLASSSRQHRLCRKVPESVDAGSPASELATGSGTSWQPAHASDGAGMSQEPAASNGCFEQSGQPSGPLASETAVAGSPQPMHEAGEALSAMDGRLQRESGRTQPAASETDTANVQPCDPSPEAQGMQGRQGQMDLPSGQPDAGQQQSELSAKPGSSRPRHYWGQVRHLPALTSA